MMRRISKLAFLLFAPVLFFALPLLSNAQSLTLSSFTIGAAPDPVGIDSYTTLSAAVTGPAGVPAPDGNIDFYISSNSASCSADLNDIGTVTLSTADTTTLNFYVRTTGTVAICANYTAIATNYAPATAGPFLLTVYSLNSIKPALAIVGAANTNVTLTGLGFTGNSVPQIYVSGAWTTLPVNSLTATQIQTTIPAADLATAASLPVQVITGSLTSGPVSFQIYSPYSVNTTVTAVPATFAYGSTLTSVLSGTAARSVSIDAAVPGGPANFVLEPASGPNITLGTAQLTQVTNPGAYFNTYTGLFDTNGTQKLIAMDLNGDGNIDVVGMPGVTYGQTAFAPFLQVFLSTGANAFQTEEDVYTVCDAVDFAVGDINNDGIPDLVVVCPGPPATAAPPPLQAYYMLGNGDGSFQSPVQFGSGSFVSSPSQVVLGNFNNDGYNDIAVIDGSGGFLQVISPFVTNTYGPYVDFDITNGSVVSAGAADFNQDGLTDIVLEEYIYPDGNLTFGAVLSLVNSLITSGAPGFTLQSEAQFSAEANFMQSMTVTDVNGDGYPDVAITDPGDNFSGSPDTGNILIFENDGTGGLPLTLTYPAANAGAVAGAPFPLVGKPATTAAIAPGWNLVYSAPGTNGDIFVTEIQRQSASAWTQVSTADTGTTPYNTDGGVEPGFIVTGDMNGDGFLDFAATGTAIVGDQTQFELLPYYYGNDAQATLNVSTQLPTPGSYTLNMTYAGNQLFLANTAATPITIARGTVTGNVTGPGTAAYGALVTLNATITGVAGGAAPSGSVTFFDGTNPLGTVGLTPVSGVISTASYSVSALSAGTHGIQISYTGDANYAPAAATSLGSTSLSITAATPTISWTAPAAITYGTALSATQLDASSTVAGSFAYTPASGTVLGAGSQTLSVTFTPTDTTDYTTATKTVALTVNKARLTVKANNAIRAYDTANPTFTDTITGFVNGDTQSVVSGAASLTTTATLTSTVGSYPIPAALGTLSASNYTFSFVNGILTITQATPAITWPAPAAITYGKALSATQLDASSTVAGTFVYTPAAGAVLNPGTQTLSVTFTPTDRVDYTTATQTVNLTVNPPQTSDTAPTENVGTASGTQTVGIVMAGSFTLGSIRVVTQGALNLDFNLASGGTCAVGTAYTAGQACTVDFIFKPTAPGKRMGAILVYDNTSPTPVLQATVFLNGTGTGPQIAYSPSPAIAIDPTVNGASLNFSTGVAVDGARDVFIADTTNSRIVEVPAGGGTPTAIDPTVNDEALESPWYVAVDGAGDLIIVDTGHSRVVEVPAGGGAATAIDPMVNGEALEGPFGAAVDGTGNLYIADTGHNRVVEVPAGGGTPTAIDPTVNGEALKSPFGVTLDGAGDLFIADNNNNRIVEVPAGGGASTAIDPTVDGEGLLNPYGVELDAAGNLFITDQGNTRVVEVPAGGGAPIAIRPTVDGLTLLAPESLAMDGAGDLFIADGNFSRIVEVQRSQPPALSFPTSTAVSTTDTADGTMTVQVQNIGNLALNITAVGYPADFSAAGDPNPCTGSTSLNGGQLCDLPIQFTPRNLGALSENLSLTDNNLNASNATQTIALGGTGVVGTTTSLASSPNPATFGQSVTFTATVAATSGTSRPTGAVQFTVDGTTIGPVLFNGVAANGSTASYATSTLTAGTHIITAVYIPSTGSDFSASGPSALGLVVNRSAPTISWAAPASITYGTALSATQLDATSSLPGTFAYTPALGTVLKAGAQTLSVTFTPTDVTDYQASTATVSLQVNQATPVITWPSPGTMNYGTPLSSIQLDATATPPGGTFTYKPPAGTTLPIGTQTLSVTYVAADTVDYATATATTTVDVMAASLTLSSIAPTSAPYGSAATTIILTGIGFTPNSVVQLNGTAIPTKYISPTQLSAQIPASFFQQLKAGAITVFDSVRNLTSASATFTVSLPNLQVSFSGPGSVPPGEQPSLNFTISQAYPIAIQGTMTLTVDPLKSGGPVDPSVQFSTGGTTYNFTIPAGSTTTPTVQIQTGTLSATITVTLTLQADGQDVTPPGILPVVVTVPDTAPVIASATLRRSGNTLTVVVQGYSSTREVSQATFDFTPSPGSSISNPDIDVAVSTDFTTWYSGDTSVQYGSSFSYEQEFNLSNDASTIGGVSVVLTNSVGQSNQVTAH